jgi:hypothetical protein
VKFKNKYFILALVNSIFIYYVYFINNTNIDSGGRFVISFFIHSLALTIGIGLLEFQKLPFVIPFAVFNVVSYAVSPMVIDFKAFQLNVFEPSNLDLFNQGFLVFYVTYFFIVFYRINTKKAATQNMNLNFPHIQLVLFVVYILTFFLPDLFLFLHTYSTNWLLGTLVCGFFFKKNSNVSTFLMLYVLSFEIINIILSGLIYPLFFFLFFLVLTLIVFNIKFKSSFIFVLPILLSGFLFASIFSKIKMRYRNVDLTNLSIVDKVNVINELTTESNIENENTENNIFWRLTYPLSGLSLVRNKTPSIVPFLNGESYMPVISKFIPRFLWYNKPREAMGQFFGHRYDILANDNLTTSMNCPMVAESYMNFGMIGFWFFFIGYAVVMSLMFFGINEKSYNSSNPLIEMLNRINLCFVAVYFLQMESNFSMFFGKILMIQIVMVIIKFGVNKKNINYGL